MDSLGEVGEPDGLEVQITLHCGNAAVDGGCQQFAQGEVAPLLYESLDVAEEDVVAVELSGIPTPSVVGAKELRHQEFLRRGSFFGRVQRRKGLTNLSRHQLVLP